MAEYKSKAMQELQQRRNDPAKGVMTELLKMRDSVERMTGERGSDRAVRVSDVSGVGKLQMKSKQIKSFEATYPSKEEYNALQADVAAIFAALNKIATSATVKKK